MAVNKNTVKWVLVGIVVGVVIANRVRAISPIPIPSV